MGLKTIRCFKLGAILGASVFLAYVGHEKDILLLALPAAFSVGYHAMAFLDEIL